MPSREKLAEFTAWCAKHITGDEKGEAQIFLDHLFNGFGHPGGLKEAGATLEMRVSKADGNGNSFADLVWKPIVLVEMKKRGENLQKHYRQAFDYWTRLVPNRPRYVVLCNFDEFRVYDFDTDLDTPKDTLALKDLPERWGPLEFLAPGNPKPNFENDRVAVTTQAADKLAECFKTLLKRGEPRDMAQKFILQMLVALFAEDIGLLPKYFVTNLLAECKTPADGYDIIGGLLEAMNSKGPKTGGRFKGVPYFNGGLFKEPARIEIHEIELNLLKKAAEQNWSKVQPEIFGTLFQHSMDDEERHAFGAHFTHPSDIMKIVKPTITDPWSEQIESAKTFKRLRELRDRMHTFRVLDPACGSGNFLYIAYRELKRLEARIYERIDTEFPKHASEGEGQMRFSYLSAQNFYGLDILPFAVEIAKVTMMIGRKLAIDELHITEQPLPLDNLDNNFIAGDALIRSEPIGLTGKQANWRRALLENGKLIFVDWPKADVIIGNPPFNGAKKLKPDLGPDYVKAIRQAYPDVPGMADYCVSWIRKAHDHLPRCTAADPVAGRAGLVGTQNIRNNQSRVGGLDYVVKTGTILEAVQNQPWSGEANVNVSIVNWTKTQEAALLPKTRKLWFKVEPSAAAKKLRKRGSGPASKEYELDFRECTHINSALSDETDVSSAVALACNTKPQRVFQGITHGHKAFLLSPTEKAQLLSEDPSSVPVIFPYLVGNELVTGSGTPSRFLINFEQRDVNAAQAFAKAFARVERSVLPQRIKAANQGKDANGNMRPHHKQFLDRWWKLTWDRADLLAAIRRLSGRYIVCSRTTKRPIFSFISAEIQPGDALQAFTFDDDYSYGILQAGIHWLWFVTKCSKQTERPRYTSESIFDTFPWPQTATVKQIDAVAAAARELRRVRAEALPKLKGGLRALYRTLELPGANPLKDAHAALDTAVLTAYGFSAKKDLLAQLLALNQQVAAQIEKGEPVMPPGVPKNYPDAKKLVTEDCIKPT